MQHRLYHGFYHQEHLAEEERRQQQRMQQLGQRLLHQPGGGPDHGLPRGQEELHNPPEQEEGQHRGGGNQQEQSLQQRGEPRRVPEHLGRRKAVLRRVKDPHQPDPQILVAQRRRHQEDSGQDHAGGGLCQPPVPAVRKALLPLRPLLPHGLPGKGRQQRQKGDGEHKQHQNRNHGEDKDGVVCRDAQHLGQSARKAQPQAGVPLEADPGPDHGGQGYRAEQRGANPPAHGPGLMEEPGPDLLPALQNRVNKDDEQQDGRHIDHHHADAHQRVEGIGEEPGGGGYVGEHGDRLQHIPDHRQHIRNILPHVV